MREGEGDRWGLNVSEEEQMGKLKRVREECRNIDREIHFSE